MKKTALTLLAMTLCGCVLACGPRPVSPKEASESVYKIHGEIQVRERPKDNPLEGLRLRDEADYDLTRLGDGTLHASWTGTAWTADRARGRSFLMTAGHVCETRDVIVQRDFFGEETTYDVVSVTYSIEAADGTFFKSVTVVADDDDSDLCLVALPGDLGTPLPIATEDPDYAAQGYYIGAPVGIWGGGIAGYYPARFSGRGRPWKKLTNEVLAFSTAQAAPGASGSPYIFGGRVVALLNLGHGRFFTFSTGVPHDEIRAFIARARNRN